LNTSGEAYCGDNPNQKIFVLTKEKKKERNKRKKRKPWGEALRWPVTANPKSQITARISSGLFVCPLSIKIYFKWLVFEQEEKV